MAKKTKMVKYNLRTAAGRAAHARQWAKLHQVTRNLIKTLEEPLPSAYPPTPPTAYWKVGV